MENRNISTSELVKSCLAKNQKKKKTKNKKQKQSCLARDGLGGGRTFYYDSKCNGITEIIVCHQ